MLYLYDINQLNSNSDALMRMGCWPASLEEMKLLLFVCTLILYCDRNPPTLRTTSDLMMNVHTCVTETNTCTMVYVRSLCQI
jgi:hypothetical protein